MSRLDAVTCNIAIGRLQAEESQNAFARRYNVHRSTLFSLWERYQQQGTKQDRHHSGRQRVTAVIQDLDLVVPPEE